MNGAIVGTELGEQSKQLLLRMGCSRPHAVQSSNREDIVSQNANEDVMQISTHDSLVSS